RRATKPACGPPPPPPQLSPSTPVPPLRRVSVPILRQEASAVWCASAASADAPTSGADSPASRAGASVGVTLGSPRSCAEACLLASFFACFSSRRARSLFSRSRFAIVVFFLPVEAMALPGSAERQRVRSTDPLVAAVVLCFREP